MTKDGYVNVVHRVYKDAPYILSQNDSEQSIVQKPALLIIHGLEDSSDAYLLNRDDKSPALVAASAGYDVWIPNHRGNYYSRDHLWLDSTKDA